MCVAQRMTCHSPEARAAAHCDGRRVAHRGPHGGRAGERREALLRPQVSYRSASPGLPAPKFSQ